jgi:phosphoribosylformimino-5-aminoimidazole carboxamide ribotide isomerase
VIPAIDLRGGKCVRLTQGDYARETVFAGDPVDTARRWVAEGAERLHVVDLDGARDGVRANATAVASIIRSVSVPVQVGGGIRTVADAASLLSAGADRVMFGTAAIEDPAVVKDTVARYGAQRVIVSIDARDQVVGTRGWTKSSGELASDVALRLAEQAGVRRFMYTDISKDGTLSHPNFTAAASIIRKVGYPIVIGGGVATIEDLVELGRLGAEAAVTGLAIYTGALDLGRAIRQLKAAKA